MKRFLMVVCMVMSLMIMPSIVLASPYLRCDPYTIGPNQPDQFVVTIDSASPIISPAEVMADGKTRLNYDLVGITTGIHSFKVKAGISLWGTESVEIPFSCTKPVSVASPVAIGLAK